MSKDAPDNPATKTGGVSFFSEIVHSNAWKRALFVCALAGVGMGALNFTAASYEWPVTDWFDTLDTPVTSLMGFAEDHFDFPANLGLEPLAVSLIVEVCYWMLIGLLLTPVYCFVRVGGIKRILRDRTCRRQLKFGIGGGISAGSAIFLTTLNDIVVLNFTENVCAFAVMTVFWGMFGLLVATPFSLVRVLKMK